MRDSLTESHEADSQTRSHAESVYSHVSYAPHKVLSASNAHLFCCCGRRGNSLMWSVEWSHSLLMRLLRPQNRECIFWRVGDGTRPLSARAWRDCRMAGCNLSSRRRRKAATRLACREMDVRRAGEWPAYAGGRPVKTAPAARCQVSTGASRAARR